MFDEEPEGDQHGECAKEIHDLQAKVTEAFNRILELQRLEESSRRVAENEAASAAKWREELKAKELQNDELMAIIRAVRNRYDVGLCDCPASKIGEPHLSGCLLKCVLKATKNEKRNDPKAAYCDCICHRGATTKFECHCCSGKVNGG